MARRLFSSFTPEQLSELPRLTVSWTAALSIAGGAAALGWTGTTLITQVQKADTETNTNKRFNELELKLDSFKLETKGSMDSFKLEMKDTMLEMKYSMQRLETLLG